jgi:RNA methyltransferase, TrmH family
MNPEIITSPENQRVKNLVKLKKKSDRVEQNLILIEGWREIKQAVAGGLQLKTIYLSQEKSSNHFLEQAGNCVVKL